MTFLNASLLAGLLAAAIPVVVHLMSRREPRRIVFPATRFVKQRIASSQKRLQVRRWWLLGWRILILVALAFALARPTVATAFSSAWIASGLLAVLGAALLAMAGVARIRERLPGLGYALGGAALLSWIASLAIAGVSAVSGPEVTTREDLPVALALVLDNSVRSLRNLSDDTPAGETAARATGPSRVIDQIRDQANWILGRFPADSRIAIIDRSPRPAAFALDVASAARQIERTEPLALSRPLAERVEAAVRLVRSSELDRRIVVVVTDLTQRSFPAQEWERGRVAALLAEEPPLRIQILDVGTAAADNLMLELPEIADATPPQMTPTAISIRLTSEGPRGPSGGGQTDEALPPKQTRPSASAIVELQIYESGTPAAAGLPLVRNSEVLLPTLRVADRKTIPIIDGTSRALLSVPPLEVGTHHGVVRIVGGDELAIDDERFFTLQVRSAPSILLVSTDRASADVIAGALTAPRSPTDPMAEYRVEIAELLPSRREEYGEHDLIILVDPPPVSQTASSDLQSYLENGGKLVTLLGPSMAMDERLAVDTPDGGFPGGLVRRWRVPAPGTFLEIERPQHPSVAAFAEIAGGVPWNAFRIGQYWELDARESGDTVVIRYAGTEHPALLQRGSNHLILTTPLPALVEPARAWNELFAGTDAWPAFLLTRGMIQSLADQGWGARNLMITDVPRFRISPQGTNTLNTSSVGSPAGQASVIDASIVPSESTGDLRVQMFPPRGPVVPLRARDSWLTVGGVDWPGTYWIRGEGLITGFSINLMPAQTDLSRLDPALFDAWLGPERYDLVRERDALLRVQDGGDPTRPLYGWLLVLGIAAFALEQVIANRFYRRSGRKIDTRGVRAA